MEQQVRFCTAPDGVHITYGITGTGPPWCGRPPGRPIWITAGARFTSLARRGHVIGSDLAWPLLVGEIRRFLVEDDRPVPDRRQPVLASRPDEELPDPPAECACS